MNCTAVIGAEFNEGVAVNKESNKALTYKVICYFCGNFFGCCFFFSSFFYCFSCFFAFLCSFFCCLFCCFFSSRCFFNNCSKFRRGRSVLDKPDYRKSHCFLVVTGDGVEGIILTVNLTCECERLTLDIFKSCDCT